MKNTRMIAAGCVVAVGLALCGCSYKPSKGWSLSDGSFTRVDGDARYSYTQSALACDGRQCLVVALAGGTGDSFHSSDGKCQVEFIGRDGKKVPMSCDLKGDGTGSVAIDGQPFDIAQGGLFVIAAETSPALVVQVALDETRLASCKDSSNFVALLKSDARLTNFLQSCKNPK
jgi:hypothetical protein